MRKLALTLVLSLLLLPACGGGGSGGGIEPAEAFARLIENADGGTMVVLSDGSSVMHVRTPEDPLTYVDPNGGAPQDLGTEPVLACIAPDGALLWQRELERDAYMVTGFAATAQGTFWMFGWAESSVEIDGFVLDIEDQETMVFGVHFDRRGRVIGVKVHAIGRALLRAKFAVGADGSMAMAITLTGTTIWNPAEADRDPTSNTADDLHIVRYDSTGRLLWRKRAMSDGNRVFATALCLRPDGDVVCHFHYTEGSTTILWVDGVEENPRLNGDSALAQLDPTGLLVSLYTSPTADWTVFGIAPHLDGHVLSGRFIGALRDANGGDQHVEAGDDSTGFVMRCGDDGRPHWTMLQFPRDGPDNRGVFFSVDTDPAGRILLAGEVSGTATFQSRGVGYVVDSFGLSDNGVVQVLAADGGPIFITTIRSEEWSAAGPAWFLPNGEMVVKGEARDTFYIEDSPIDVDFGGNAVFFLRLNPNAAPEPAQDPVDK